MGEGVTELRSQPWKHMLVQKKQTPKRVCWGSQGWEVGGGEAWSGHLEVTGRQQLLVGEAARRAPRKD